MAERVHVLECVGVMSEWEIWHQIHVLSDTTDIYGASHTMLCICIKHFSPQNQTAFQALSSFIKFSHTDLIDLKSFLNRPRINLNTVCVKTPHCCSLWCADGLSLWIKMTPFSVGWRNLDWKCTSRIYTGLQYSTAATLGNITNGWFLFIFWSIFPHIFCTSEIPPASSNRAAGF